MDCTRILDGLQGDGTVDSRYIVELCHVMTNAIMIEAWVAGDFDARSCSDDLNKLPQIVLIALGLLRVAMDCNIRSDI